MTLTGTVEVVERDSAGWGRASEVYLARFPESATRFELGDFHLLRLRLASIRYVGGFARALSLSPADLANAAAALSRNTGGR